MYMHFKINIIFLIKLKQKLLFIHFFFSLDKEFSLQKQIEKKLQ